MDAPGARGPLAALARGSGGVVRVGLVLVSLLYPFVALSALRRIGPAALIGLLCLLLVLRALFGSRNAAMTLMTWALIGVAAAMLAVGLVDAGLAVRLYPVFMNLAMLAAFASTLARGPSMIERFARITRPDLSAHAVAYTRKATIAWCLFLAANALVSLAVTLTGSWQAWTLYNGFLSYIAIALFAGCEYCVRRRARRHAGAA